MVKTTKKNKIEQLKQKARALYALGFTCREIAKKIPRSRTWVSNVVSDSGQKLDKDS